MIDPSPTIPDRLPRLREVLRRAGVKATPQRLEIFREVAGSVDHPDAEAVHHGVRKRMPTVSLDTVYRTLWLFRDLGLIRTLTPSHDRARFDANLAPHHHFICTRCGRTRDFTSGELDALAIPKAVQAFGRIESTRVEVHGCCRECAQRKPPSVASNRKTHAARRKENEDE
jgi:Fur family peroxide stress response transcriptional regulator